jgi:Hypothetical protein TTHB210
MSWYHQCRGGLIAGVAIMGLAACSAQPQVVQGECQQVFGGQVCTWGTVADGVATEFGATVAMATVQNAPLEGEMVFPPVAEAVIPLPAAVAQATGFDHLGVNWERHGHPPALFMTPHFDFHFYTVGNDRIQAIDCADTRKPANLPAAYALPDVEVPGMGTLVGLCVPHMGMHSMPSAELDQTDPFDASMIVGYYGGSLLFVEPMIARTKLAASQTFSMAMPPAPPDTPATVRWPSQFQAVYDAGAKLYRLTFSLPSK